MYLSKEEKMTRYVEVWNFITNFFAKVLGTSFFVDRKNIEWEIFRTLPFQKKPMLIDGTRANEDFTMRRYRLGKYEYRSLTTREWLEHEESEAL